MSLLGQPTVISNTNISATVNASGLVTFTSPIGLIRGQTYRWWVRGISSNNENGPWSQPIDFRVVENSNDIFNSPVAGFGEGIAVPVVATIDAQLSFDDDVQSISIHPAGTVIQLSPPEVLEASIGDERELVSELISQPDAGGIDAMMELWADGDVHFELTDTPPVDVGESSDKQQPENDSQAKVPGKPVQDRNTATSLQAGSLWAGFVAIAGRKPARRNRLDET